MIKGADVSKWQGTIDFDALRPSIDFIVIRSGFGNGGVDGQFARNRDEARRVGLLCGFYHYAYPTYNHPKAEADWFCKVIGTPKKGEFLVLDFEEAYGDPVGWSKKFLDRVSKNLGGYKPLIYLNKQFLNNDWSSVINEDYGLWLAYWTYNPDSIDFDKGVPWPNVAMRQYSNKESFPGIEGRVDANVFYGSKEQLLKYGYQGQPVDPQPEPPKIKMLPKDSVIGDIYEFLTGDRATQDETDWRLASEKNLVEIGNDICAGDTRFQERWVTPPVSPIELTDPPVSPHNCPDPDLLKAEEAIAIVKELVSQEKNIFYKLLKVLSFI